MAQWKNGRKGRGTRRNWSRQTAGVGLAGHPGRNPKRALARGAEPALATIDGPPGQTPSSVEAQAQIGNTHSLPLPDDVIFDLNQKRTRFSDQILLDQVRSFARTVGGRAFAVEEFMAWPARQCTARCISKRFGSWRRALTAAGIHGAFAGRYNAQELMDRLESAWRAIGRRPGYRALHKHAHVTPTPYRHRWGTYMNACTRFARFKRGQITLKDLLRPTVQGVRKSISPGTRWNVLNRDRHRCRSCGRGPRRGNVRLEVDHIVPVVAGGSNAMSNLRALCRDCNRGKGRKVNVKRWKRSMRRSGNRLRSGR